MMRSLIAAATLAALSLVTPVSAEVVDYFDLPTPLKNQDLSYPDQPTAFMASPGANRMFKPEGAGPFPAVVLLPTCSGHYFMNTFDWAKRALDRGYAVLVVDPLGPRGVGSNNCTPPQAVGTRRFMKDGFDAAEHLRKQPFVDADHVGLMGFSLGAMAGLGAAGAKHARDRGRPFQAIVAAYPACKFPNFKMPSSGQVVDLHFLQDTIAVPLLVLMGDRDNETHAVRDCLPMLEPLKSVGNPIDYRMYHATHCWDARETRTKPFSKRGFLDGETIVYEYDDAVTEQSARDAFAFLDVHLKKK